MSDDDPKDCCCTDLAPAQYDANLYPREAQMGEWQSQRVVNYNDLGPGYLSAFGIVAGYFVIPGKNGRPDWDKGIRAHGSSNYMSIMSKRGFSHGCHRLQNDRAIRLYGFLLSRRNHKVFGEMEEAFRRMYLHNDEVYEMYLPSQGFKYELDPPIDVEVLEGTIEGKEEEPIEDLMIPGKEYPVPHDFVDRLEEEASISDAGLPNSKETDASVVLGRDALVDIEALSHQRNVTDPFDQRYQETVFLQTFRYRIIGLISASLQHVIRGDTEL